MPRLPRCATPQGLQAEAGTGSDCPLHSGLLIALKRQGELETVLRVMERVYAPALPLRDPPVNGVRPLADAPWKREKLGRPPLPISQQVLKGG